MRSIRPPGFRHRGLSRIPASHASSRASRSSSRRLPVTLVLLLAFVATAAAEVCPKPQVPKAERDAADQPLFLSDAERAEAIQTHLPVPRRGRSCSEY